MYRIGIGGNLVSGFTRGDDRYRDWFYVVALLCSIEDVRGKFSKIEKIKP